MAMTASADVPMGEINMTPLIDVMLVLLVMFIITIRLQTHAVKIDLPNDCPACPRPDRLKNDLVITNDGRLLWNGSQIRQDQLPWTLARTAQNNPQPELHIRPESEARFELVDDALATIKRAGVTRMGFVGNETYKRF